MVQWLRRHTPLSELGLNYGGRKGIRPNLPPSAAWYLWYMYLGRQVRALEQEVNHVTFGRFIFTHDSVMHRCKKNVFLRFLFRVCFFTFFNVFYFPFFLFLKTFIENTI